MFPLRTKLLKAESRGAKHRRTHTVDLRMLLRGLREFTEVKELTPTIVNTLIQRIEVHNNDKYDGHCHVKVDIYFTAVGMITLPTEKELEKMMDDIRKNPQQYRFTA